MDNNLAVAGSVSAGTLSSGQGIFASATLNVTALLGNGTNGADGVHGNTDTGNAVRATATDTGTGVLARSFGSRPAGQFDAEADGTALLARSFGTSSAGQFDAEAGGIGLLARSFGTGLAGELVGDVLVNGNFSATGTKNLLQAHPSDPGKKIVYVALEAARPGPMCVAPASSRTARRCWRCRSISGWSPRTTG